MTIFGFLSLGCVLALMVLGASVAPKRAKVTVSNNHRANRARNITK
ncbi:hypothetical protein N9A67_05940 [Rhodobacteraceae bacterium]|nr:hypothetical protein [Paracoccaceae bacterium]